MNGLTLPSAQCNQENSLLRRGNLNNCTPSADGKYRGGLRCLDFQGCSLNIDLKCASPDNRHCLARLMNLIYHPSAIPTASPA